MIDFTKEERNTIAEFVFSYQSDILIVTDATKLVDVLAKNNLISEAEKSYFHKKIELKDDGVCFELFKIVSEKISDEQGESIMNEYYKGGA